MRCGPVVRRRGSFECLPAVLVFQGFLDRPSAELVLSCAASSGTPFEMRMALSSECVLGRSGPPARSSPGWLSVAKEWCHCLR